MRFRKLIRSIWRRITGRDSSSSTSNDDNEGRRRRRWRWCRSSPIPYYRPNPGWPPDYGSDTPDTDEAPNRQSRRTSLPSERADDRTPPPPYPGPEPPPPYPGNEQVISASASEIERRGRETSESIYGETIYEFPTFRSLPELTATSASSSELDRRDRHPTSVHAGVLRKKR